MRVPVSTDVVCSLCHGQRISYFVCAVVSSRRRLSTPALSSRSSRLNELLSRPRPDLPADPPPDLSTLRNSRSIILKSSSPRSSTVEGEPASCCPVSVKYLERE